MRTWVWLFTALLILPGSLSAGGNTLFVFLPTHVRATALQERMSEQCAYLDVTVFGRSRDFRKQVQLSKPSAILTLPPLVATQAGYQATLSGRKSDSDSEPYFLVSIDTPVAVEALASKRLGVVDWLGRKGMSQFVKEIFGAPIKLKRVVKQEDLLPLLTFGFVEAIFVSKTTYEELKQTSNLNLVIVNTHKPVRLPVVATSPEGDRKTIKKCFMSLDEKTQQLLGVEQWSDS